MNTFTAECCDRFVALSEEEFHNEETRRHLQKDIERMQSILSTVKELLMLDSSYPLTVEDAAYILEEDPLELHEIIKENQSLLSLDGWKEPYLPVRALFRLATFLPKNPIAQECVYHLLNIALK